MSSQSIIIDSSVAIKWYLPDESDSNALKVRSDFTDGNILISVPTLFFYEVSNILRTSTKTLRLIRQKSIQAYQELLQLNFVSYASKELFKAALERGLQLDLTAYDASYVVLAENLQIPFYSADKKLVKKASADLVRKLEDY